MWAHGFVTADGARLSKTAGVWIDLDEAIARHGADALRYFLLREIPFDGDGDFSWARFDARYTADLANTLGNLTSRVVALIARMPGGRVPAPPADATRVGAALQRLRSWRARSAALVRYDEAFESFLPHDALAAMWSMLGAANECITRGAMDAGADPADGASFDATVATLVACWPVRPCCSRRCCPRRRTSCGER